MARPSSPMISRELAIKTTLELIDEEGYEAFSLSKLARRMGVRTPSLYYYFSGLDDVLEEAAQELPSPTPWSCRRTSAARSCSPRPECRSRTSGP